ncbi:ATP-binding protein [Coleofasciculus sp.]|uniref:ATP-binding protein n=1 Tax=Coleofasciculus sp. TaxID=3100458 RepID=UPI003A34EE7D
MWTVLANYIPHGHCYLWQPGLVWLHLLSDSLTGLAYYSIPVTLVYFVRKRQDLPFDWIFWLFSAFILACGTTHIMGVWTLWHPDYWVSGLIKAITAIVSLATAVLLVQLIPKALALPSPAQLEQEIRERKTAETELQHTLQRLTFHVENSPLAVIEWDSHYQVQRWSQQAEQIFGWKAEEVLGRHIDELQLVFTEDRDAVDVVMTNLLDGSTPRCICCNRNYTKEGSVIDCEWYSSALRDDADNLVSILSLALDITSRKQAETALQQVNLELERCLDSVIDVLAVQAEAKGLELAILIESNVPRQLQNDPGRLRQILLNLVGNAIKFTDAGEVVVRVAVSGHQPTDTLSQSTVTLRFSVTDTGIGISAADQSKLFQSFSQVEASTTRRYGGTGLGLVICQQLVDLLGGKIGVESKAGQGSTFWFTVPVKTQPAVNPHRPPKPFP